MDRQNSPRRRVPSQERSRKRVAAILAAAAAEFAEFGLDRATIEGIARRARTSVGSIYQFFPNKTALYRAVAEDCLDRSRELSESLLAATDGLTLPPLELVDLAVDAFVRLTIEDPGFRALSRNIQHWGLHAEEDYALLLEMVASTESVLARHTAHLPDEERATVARMIVTSIASLTVFLALESDEAITKQMVAHTKLMLRRYLEPFLA